MYSFAQREDTTVVDEPLYGYYLSHTGAVAYHPGGEEVVADQENDAQKVIEDVVFGDYDTPVVMFKHMTHHLVDLDYSFMKDTINIILTREPKEMITSFIKQIEAPSLADTGYGMQAELIEYLQNELGQTPLVVDSKEILMDPKAKLTEICEYIGIPFDENMLAWEAGPIPEDGIWAPYWYSNVHKSTGFQPYKAKNEEVPENLQELLKECEFYYGKLITK